MNTPDETEVARRYADRRRLWEDAFRGIELAGKSVLDAGTGEGFCTRFLAERRPGRLVSVTCLAEEIAPARQRIGELAGAVEFQIADLVAMPRIADATFDVVVGDFLIAAVAGYRPFREIDCIKELVRVLKPGGRLVLTGWDAASSDVANGTIDPFASTRRTFLELVRLREALHMLTDTAIFREHPAAWIADRLAELDMPVERTCAVADMHRSFDWLVRQIRRLIADLADESLETAFAKIVDDLESRIRTDRGLSLGFPFGRLYAVVACKLTGGIVIASP